MARVDRGVRGGLHAATRHHGSQRRAAGYRQGAEHLLHRPAVGRGRLRAHPRGHDAQRGLARRPARPQAGLPRGDRALHARFGPLRRGAVADLADRRARRCRGSAAPGCSRSRSRSSRRSSTAASAARPSGSGARRSGWPWRSGRSSGGALTTYVGWRWIFFVNIPIGIACVAAGLRVLRETRDEEAGGFDVAGPPHAHGRAVRARTRPASRQRLGLVERPRRRSLRCRRRAARLVRAGRAAAGVADARHPPLQRADLHGRADHRLRDLGRDVRAVPLPAALPRERARLLGSDDRCHLPAAVAARVRRRADLRATVDTRARAVPARRRTRAMRRRAAADVGNLRLLDWTTLLPGFLVAGIGIGFVNAPLASTAVSVVEPRHAGMASGTNNTFRQIGIATGIAALGAIFQSRIASVPHRVGHRCAADLVHPFAQAIASGPPAAAHCRRRASPEVLTGADRPLGLHPPA